MAIKKILFLLFSLSILVSCTSTNDCFVADIVEEARTVELKNNKTQLNEIILKQNQLTQHIQTLEEQWLQSNEELEHLNTEIS